MPTPAARVASASSTLLCAWLFAASSFAATGTDLAYGYEWWDTADGATPGLGFFDPTVTQLNPADNSAPMEVLLPWTFPFYGVMQNRLWISDNGWISFEDPGLDSHPTPLSLPSPTTPPQIVAAFWGDLDCSDPGIGTNVRHGRVDAAGAYRVQWSALEVASGAQVFFDIHLFQDGRIKLQYRSVPDFTATTTGIQDSAGGDGFAVVDLGVPAPGVPDVPIADYVIDIQPPSLLATECGAVPALSCGSNTLNESLPGSLPENVAAYGCEAAAYWGRERIHTLTLTEATRLTATLTPGTGIDLAMFLLQDCSERDCLAGPATALDELLGPGTYHLVVDAPFQADEGSYMLQVDCGPLAPSITCGDVVNDDTAGGTNLLFAAPCSGAQVFTGPERLYSIDVASPNSIRAELTAAPELSLRLYSVPPDRALAPEDCLQWDERAVVLGGLPAGEYLLAVDGLSGLSGPFTLETSCSVDLACNVQGTVDFATGTRQSITDDTSTGVASVPLYDCERAVPQDGAELVYELLLDRPGQVAIRELGGASGLSFFVLDDCNEGTCAGSLGGGCAESLDAGLHYLVVDSPAGAEGPFEIELVFSEPAGHWSDCETLESFPPPDPLPTSSTVWNFSDGAFCHTDPASLNYPDGCSFAMYVAIRCGTAFHIPLYDVESGHVRVFDVFRDQYVDLTAISTSGWTATGDDISWQDCEGMDANWNDQTTDVFFENSEGLCGVYRLEFPEHAGFVWDLHANCSGMAMGEYPIHDSLCGALEAFDPLPDVSLEVADIVVDCPDFTANYTLINRGCAEATDVTVTVFDDGVPIASELVPLILPGETWMGMIPGSFPGGLSSNTVTIEVDPGDLVAECNEVPGAGCLGPGLDVSVVANCSPECIVTAAASASSTVSCDGAPFTIDASASLLSGCLAGTVEYQVSHPEGTLSWQASPIFPGISPSASADYEVEVRCQNMTMTMECSDSVTVRVEADWRPLFDPAGVSVLEGPCDQGIQLAWTPATFLGLTASGVYNVHRSTVSCADAVMPGSPTRQLLTTTTTPFYLDLATTPGETYFYVVEAEDDSVHVGGCQPVGFSAGGAATRAEASGGTCTGVLERLGQDPALLPRVGTGLRVGAPESYSRTGATLHWNSDRPIDLMADEHFHLQRSLTPDAGFAQINPIGPPFLQFPRFADSTATQPATGSQVLFYLVFTSDACHVDNEAFDRFSSF